jgi:hypothetical protein
MFSWLGIAAQALKLFNWFAGFIRDSKMIALGRAEQTAKNLEEHNARVDEGNRIADEVAEDDIAKQRKEAQET